VRPYVEKTYTTKKKKKKKSGGVAQSVGPEFKPQYQTHTQNIQKNVQTNNLTMQDSGAHNLIGG
jgi:hypothetical protein